VAVGLEVNGQLIAGKNRKKQFGQWAIEPCELHRVYPLLEQRIDDLRTMLDDMRGQRDDMRGQRNDMRHERDHWREQAQRLALADQRERTAAAAPLAKPEPERRPWWRRLAG
jgi:hypothetical protein